MLIVDVFEIVGTIAFAISGALVGIQKKLDLFGVALLGITTAVGGGIFRDLILGNTPPIAFTSPTSSIISLISSLLIFFFYPLSVRKIARGQKNKKVRKEDGLKYLTQEQKSKIIAKQMQLNNLKQLIFICDAIGLATFTAGGAHQAYYSNPNNVFLIVFMGLITGVGGGIVRDVLVQQTPLILRREIYAVASILGGVAFYLCIKFFNYNVAFAICFLITFTMRVISIKYNLNLPRY
ncbi:Uncharacterized membrane protein YeiH [Hathewaya proteolytica DSM 3090]|uniref:Uncharacterized membrane protein YeiH n=1 Tax=Hathewaya proteolytica DSM 3090 TaxID=1121331 RepID=A0A1M6MHU2_9CLOT|nr:trimeric intracellular cation channel family protein [Hathewaya proteolytica]SHJ82853.1 Uncharacterized membrane protein YeiH [Hathewaya proteolytica DSM 3090]